MIAPSDFSGLAHEPGIWRRADGYREQAAVAQLLADLKQQFTLVADTAVGDEDDLPQQTGL